MVSISLDFSLFIQLANFVFLILALNHFLYRPIRQILAERRALFDRLRDKASKAKAELENGEAEKTRLNAESLRQALNLKNEITAKSQAEEKTLLAEAHEQAGRQLSDGRAKLQQSVSAARAALTQETKSIAREIAEKILGRKI
ncbi:MAG: ATP synthase F0 subunit B [Candidatus Adiutrix sp.]|jgi:F-type H+-transporting ATPase subunit b|nr:ATP synthase F0 subunit B [Candidatus Adiutrix sp.]